MRYLPICFFIIFSSFTLVAQDDSAAFDFWLGEWEVSWYGTDSSIVKGHNKIERILDGSVLQETFTDPSRNFKGRSLSVYNPRTKVWHQAWADNQGGYYNFIGDTTDGQRIFITPEVNAQGNIERMIFLNISNDALIWKWQGKKPDDSEWVDQWVIFYKRKM